MMSTCNLCGSASVSTHQENETIKYKSGFITALLPYTVCDDCGYEFVSTEQIKAGDALIREAKKAHDGLYTSEEIKAAREELGLSQAEAAELFGGGRNAFSKYERGEVAQSVAMDRLIKLCVSDEESFERLKHIVHPATCNIATGTRKSKVIEFFDYVFESHVEKEPEPDAKHSRGVEFDAMVAF